MCGLHLLLIAVVVVLAAGCDAKRSPRVGAMHRHEEWQLKMADRRGRNLMQAGGDAVATPAPAPAVGQPLQTPENALETCSLETLRKATYCEHRKEVFFEGEDADEECCRRMSEYYSDASTMSTRNCWCDPEVWAREQELELESYILLGAFFDSCVAGNFTLGSEAVAYFQDGKGPCAGLPAELEEEKPESTPVYPPRRSFAKWVREGLPDNPFLLFCFIVSIPSVVGFCIMMWPFVFHAGMEVIELPGKLRSKKAL